MKHIFIILKVFFIFFFISPSSLADEKNHDYEKINRSIHTFNDVIDQSILRPTSEVYSILPDFIELGVLNVISNFNEPSNFMNHILQGEIKSGISSLGRLAINSTIGILGIFEIADKAGLQKIPNDFGKTLAVWGLGEGQYLVLPFIGPRTARHFFGSIIDTALNPVNYRLRDEGGVISTSPSILYILSTRSRNAKIIDSLRSTSIDYYSSIKSIYLQGRGIKISLNIIEDIDIFNENFDEDINFYPGDNE